MWKESIIYVTYSILFSVILYCTFTNILVYRNRTYAELFMCVCTHICVFRGRWNLIWNTRLSTFWWRLRSCVWLGGWYTLLHLRTYRYWHVNLERDRNDPFMVWHIDELILVCDRVLSYRCRRVCIILCSCLCSCRNIGWRHVIIHLWHDTLVHMYDKTRSFAPETWWLIYTFI